ncbi:MAG: BamA/TamA family outer membrane protein, partial [Planctomycetota bacterium]
MPRSRLPTRLGLLLAGLLAAASVDALALDLKKIDLKKKYEEELIRWALKQAGLQRDPSPEGKKIERIEIVREEIIAQSDPWPNFLNWFHVKTKDFVVRQELLVAPGEVWDEEKVEESARNLRKLFILAVVRTVPCRSKKPGHVVLLVVTKDLWSLRLNTIFSQVGGVLQRLEFFPTEMNFLGRNKRVSIHLRME